MDVIKIFFIYGRSGPFLFLCFCVVFCFCFLGRKVGGHRFPASVQLMCYPPQCGTKSLLCSVNCQKTTAVLIKGIEMIRHKTPVDWIWSQLSMETYTATDCVCNLYSTCTHKYIRLTDSLNPPQASLKKKSKQIPPNH